MVNINNSARRLLHYFGDIFINITDQTMFFSENKSF